MVIASLIHHDAPEPGPKRCVVTEGAKGPVGTHEGILRDVITVGVPHQSCSKTSGLLLVATDQAPERVRVTAH